MTTSVGTTTLREITEDDVYTVAVDGGPAEYLDVGTGPALVLVHGDGQTGRDWRWVAPALAAAGHRVIAPSLPGHGATAETPSYKMEDLAAWLGRFLDVLDIDRATVGGNSIGGLIPVHLALQQPGRVSRLVLIDSAGMGNAVNPVLGMETLPLAGEAAIAMSMLPGDRSCARSCARSTCSPSRCACRRSGGSTSSAGAATGRC